MKLLTRVRKVLCMALVALCHGPVWSSPAAAQRADMSSREALAIYQDAANFQNNKAYELASQEWAKFLKRFPDDPLAAKAGHYEGVCHVQLRQHQRAIAALEKVVATYPKFELIEDTYLYLGWSQYTLARQGRVGMYDKATNSFASLLKRFPQGKSADQALFFQGEVYYALNNRKQAVAAYNKLLEDHPESALRADAIYGLGVALEEASRAAEAGRAYDRFLVEFPEHERRAEVRMRKAETMLQGGRFAEAERIFAQVALVKNFGSVDHAIYRQAHCVLKQGRLDEAGDLFARIPTSFPKSAYAGDAALQAARCRLSRERFDDARRWLAKLLATDGLQAPEAAHWLCRIHLQTNQPDKTRRLAKHWLTRARQHAYHVHLKMDYADALYDMPSRRGQSITRYREIAGDHPRHELAPQALYNAAFAALEAKNYVASLRDANRFLESYRADPLLPDVKYLAAECQLHSSRYREAEILYRELVTGYSDRPQSETWRVRLGLVLYSQKRYGETIALLERFTTRLDRVENLAEARSLVGTSHFHLGHHVQAVASLRASLAAHPEWEQVDETLWTLARAQRKLNKPDEAAATVGRLIADFPDSRLLDQAYFRLAEYRRAAGDYKAATTQYDLVISKWPQSNLVPHALFGRGWSRLREQDYAAAETSLTALISDHADHPLAAQARSARAICRQRLGRYRPGIEDVNAFVKSKPALKDRVDALYVRALCEVGLEDFQAAEGTLKAVLADSPHYADADKVRYELAWSLKALKRDAEAAETFAKLAASYPESRLAAEAHYHVAEHQYEQRAFTEAIHSYTQCKYKALKGELSEKIIYKLGWSHFQLEQHEPALAAFQELVATYPDGGLAGDGRFMKAECSFKLEQYEVALAGYLEAQNMPAPSKDVEVLILLHGGQSAAQLKKWRQSLELLARIPRKFPDSAYLAEAHYEQGWATQNLGELTAALKLYRLASDRSRSEVGARARFMMGEIYFEQKAYAPAVQQFQRVMYGYGGTSAPADIKRWQAKSAYEAGRCAEVQIAHATDVQQRSRWIAGAKKYYGEVIQRHATSDLADEAAKRLKVLEKF